MKQIRLLMMIGLLLALAACGDEGAEPTAGEATVAPPATDEPTVVVPTEEVAVLDDVEVTEIAIVADVPSVEPTVVAPTVQLEPTVVEGTEAITPGGMADADVVWVRAIQNGDSWTFHVTVAHPDTGWEDYADGWDVVLLDGTVIKPSENSPFTRLLVHPHENEQPFTRSQGGIVIPETVTMVLVRAHDLVDGFGGQEITVDLTMTSGEGYEVERP